MSSNEVEYLAYHLPKTLIELDLGYNRCSITKNSLTTLLHCIPKRLQKLCLDVWSLSMPEIRFLSSRLPNSLQELKLCSDAWITTTVTDLLQDENPTVMISRY